MQKMQDMWVRSLGWEDPLEEEVAIHTSILAWKIPWTEEPVRLQSMGLQIVKHYWVTEDSRTGICCVNQLINGRLFFMSLILSKRNSDAFLMLVVQVIPSTASFLDGPHPLNFWLLRIHLISTHCVQQTAMETINLWVVPVKSLSPDLQWKCVYLTLLKMIEAGETLTGTYHEANFSLISIFSLDISILF